MQSQRLDVVLIPLWSSRCSATLPQVHPVLVSPPGPAFPQARLAAAGPELFSLAQSQVQLVAPDTAFAGTRHAPVRVCTFCMHRCCMICVTRLPQLTLSWDGVWTT